MNGRTAAWILGAVVAGVAADVTAAEVTVLANRAFQSALQELVPAYNRTGSNQANGKFDGPGQLAQHLKDGEDIDVVIGPRVNIDEMVAAGTVRRDSVVDLVRSYVGIGVRKGAAKPDISTSESLKRTLLAARAISVPANSPSGIHFAKVLDQLGIADAVKAKFRQPKAGQFAADLLASGEADLAVQTRSELLSVPGVELLAPLPREYQGISVFSAGVPTASRQPDAGAAFIRFVRTSAGAAIIRAKAMEPLAN